ncbi:hypothetical protein Tco_0456482 [Tanacetum coccineum]
MIVDIEDDIMDPVMQCTTLPSHSGFSQKKLVSFVTEIHTLSIDISLRDLKMEILLEPTSNKLLVGTDSDFTSTVSYALSWKPCQGDSLNLPDHRIDEYPSQCLLWYLGMDQRINPIPCLCGTFWVSHLEESEVGSWPSENCYATSDNEVESDLESTARSEPNGSGNDENPDIAAIITQQLHNIIPLIVTQVTNNVNNVNANGGNGGNENSGNNGCSYKAFLWHVIPRLSWERWCGSTYKWIDKMESVIARGREAAIGMKWVEFKALFVEEFYPSNKIEKLESEF